MEIELTDKYGQTILAHACDYTKNSIVYIQNVERPFDKFDWVFKEVPHTDPYDGSWLIFFEDWHEGIFGINYCPYCGEKLSKKG